MIAMVKTRICAICGKPLKDNSSKEHFYPQAIYKWHSLALTDKEVKKLRDNIYLVKNGNILWTHQKCNYKKQDKIIPIHKLHLDRDSIDKLKKLGKTLAPNLRHYRGLKKRNYFRQGQKCYKCKRTFKNYDEGVLRRKNPNKHRSLKNSCLVCHDCNDKYARF